MCCLKHMFNSLSPVIIGGYQRTNTHTKKYARQIISIVKAITFIIITYIQILPLAEEKLQNKILRNNIILYLHTIG